ncbi:hypothetical protein NQ317_017221, partial [Molorchus minor]
ARLDKCHDLYKEFDETQFHIQLIEPSLDDQERIKFEGLYFDAVARANSYLECTIQHNERGNNLTPSSNDNPLHLIACLETTAANYTAAWKLLVDRYDNKRLKLFNLMLIHKESYVHLRQFLDNLNKHLRALECLKEPVKSWDTLLIYLVSIKLDNYTRREWEIFVKKHPTATTMNHLLEFLNKRANLLETIHCKNYEKSNCNLCKKKHHVLLHFGNANEVTSSDIPKNIENTEEHNSVIACNTLSSNEVLLSTAIVIVYDSAGVEHNCRVLLDSGSQGNYITNEFCQRLKLKKYNLNMSASGLGQIHVNIAHQIKATIKSRFNNFKQNLSFLVLDKITDNLPLNKNCLKNVVMPENIQLADPTCNVSSKIDALLGASVFWNLLSIGQIKISNSFLIAQKTKLGWILSGQVGRQIGNNGNRSVCNLSKLLTR